MFLRLSDSRVAIIPSVVGSLPRYSAFSPTSFKALTGLGPRQIFRTVESLHMKSFYNLFRSATATKRRNPSPVRIIKYRGGLLMNAFNQQIIES